MRIARLQRVFSEVDGSPLEQWVDNFRRDAELDSELVVWERMAEVYTKYCNVRGCTREEKGEVFHVLLVRSTTRDDEEALKHLNLKVLTPEEARNVMELCYGGRT